MSDPISTATPDAAPTATPATGTEAAVNGNGQPSGEANSGQSATGTDTFIPTGVDLNTLPPQVRAYVEEVNKQMVRGFTEKTTKVSETVKSQLAKELEPYRQKAQTYDELLKQEVFVQKWNEYVEDVNRKGVTNDPGDPQAKILQELEALKKSQAELSRKSQESEALDVINAFSSAVDEKGEKLHPDFEKFSKISLGTHQKAGEYDLLRTAIELAPGTNAQEKIENGYKAAKAVYDAIYEDGRKSGLARTQERIKNGSFAPSTIPAGKTTTERPKDALEALRMARQGIRVSQ